MRVRAAADPAEGRELAHEVLGALARDLDIRAQGVQRLGRLLLKVADPADAGSAAAKAVVRSRG